MRLCSPRRVSPVVAWASAVLGMMVIAGQATAAGPKPESVVRADAIRSDYTEIMATLGEIGRARRLPEVEWASARGQEIIVTLSNEEVLAFGDAMPDFVALRASVKSAAADIRSRDVRWADEGTSEAPSESRTPGAFPVANYSSQCPSPRPNTGELKSIVLLVKVARGIHAATNRLCEQKILGNTTSLACIPSDLLLFADIAILEHLFFCRKPVHP